MATECTLKVSRTRCGDVHGSASTEMEENFEDIKSQMIPLGTDDSQTSPKKSPKQSNSPVRNKKVEVPGRTENDNSDTTHTLDMLHIDTDLANEKYCTFSPEQRCLSESSYMTQCKNISVNDCKKRKLYFSETELQNEICDSEICMESGHIDIKAENTKHLENTKPSRTGARFQLRPKVDSFAELSAEEYKFRHHIGERNAVEKIVSYNERVFNKKTLQSVNELNCYMSSPTEENNNSVKSEPCPWRGPIKTEPLQTDSVCVKPEMSLPKKEESIDSGTELKQETQDIKHNKNIFDNQAQAIKEEFKEISDDDDVFRSDPKEFPANDELKDTVINTVKDTKPKTKKSKIRDIVVPAPRKRRIASLTAQTKMQLMYEKDEARPPKKARSIDDVQNLKSEKKVKVEETVEKTKTTKKKHIEDIVTDIKKGKKTEKTKAKPSGISVNTMYGNAIRVPPSSVGLTTASAIWSQPLNLAVNSVYTVDTQTQFIPIQGTPASVLNDQSTAILGSMKSGSSVMSTKQKAQKTAREKWKKKLANPTQGVRNSSRAASMNAKAVLSSTSPRKRSLSDPGEYKPKKKKQKLASGGQWVVAGLSPQYFIPNTGNTVIIGNQSALPTHTANHSVLLSKKKKRKGHSTLEGLGQQLLASAAGPNVILPSLAGGNLDANNVPQAITIGGIGSLSTPAYMPVQFAQSSVPSVGQAHFTQGFYQTSSILPSSSVPEHLQLSPPLKNNHKSGKGGKKVNDCQLVRPNIIAEPKPKQVKKSNTNGWRYQGEPFQATVCLQNDSPKVMRTCYHSIKRRGEVIKVRDCVLLKSGPRKTDLPYVAKVSALWLDPEEGEIMASLLWYYRPEHIEGGRRPHHHEAELFACKHKDYNSVATIEDKCYVLTLAEYNRHCKKAKMIEFGVKPSIPVVPSSEGEYARSERLPSPTVDKDIVFLCRHVYDYRQKRILKNPS